MDEVWVDAGYSGKQNAAAVGIVSSWGSKLSQLVLAQTNNEAEYIAVLIGCKWAKPGSTIYTDSRLIYMQVTGQFKINHDNFVAYAGQIRTLIRKKGLTLTWISREENKRADALVREVLYGEHSDSPA